MTEPDLEQQLTKAAADGRITVEDVDAVLAFAAFLRDPEIGRPGEGLSLAVMRRHQDTLGLTDEDLRQAAINRGES